MLSFIERRTAELRRSAAFVWNDSRRTVLLAVSAGWFLSLGVRMMYPVLLPHFRRAYGLDLGTVGLLLTVLWGTYAVGQLPAGVLTDRFGERTVLATSTGVSAVILTLVVTADHAAVLFGTTALFGFATALYGVARYTAVSQVFPDRDGAAIGVTLAAGSLGNMLLPATAGAVAATFAWQFGLGFVIPLFLLVAGYLWVGVPARRTGDASGGLSMATVREVGAALRNPSVGVVTLILVLGFSTFQSFTGFYPTYLIEVKHLDPAVATLLFSLYFGLAIVVQPLSGAVYDRLGIRRTLPLFLGVAFIGLVSLPLLEGVWPLAGVTVLLSCMTSNIAVTMPYLTSVLPEAVQGTGLGVLRTAYMLVGAASPTLFGLLADRGFFDEGFWALAVLVGVIVVLATRLTESAAVGRR
ncbi:MAG: nitrate/nitrite transporter [Haloarculaceae archaeon]